MIPKSSAIVCAIYIAAIDIRYIFLGHLSHSGDLLLWVGVRRRASFVARRSLSVNMFSRTTGPI